ncbi:hypothetical protein CC1G_03542 [Coprinopsis cinerea okayama7|uniref:Uncharacterized protein n=1 Tax=Coprinopsis cinerea (strain Okayama-7 / 130 / ATCC MYA-4618 / FGSC 9003) TaxID=240176 RepID=A8NCI4_COPC7|nr:hypothetical protein CC1G_03542 [Coprinopsis cinerea okayama7\|eukprot:XP_001832528.2 hypothetical protein CC1G_03542 [Coprinopsis cinerea okayama7\
MVRHLLLPVLVTVLTAREAFAAILVGGLCAGIAGPVNDTCLYAQLYRKKGNARIGSLKNAGYVPLHLEGQSSLGFHRMHSALLVPPAAMYMWMSACACDQSSAISRGGQGPLPVTTQGDNYNIPLNFNLNVIGLLVRPPLDSMASSPQ